MSKYYDSMDIKWVERFVALTEMVASWSKDPKRQIGCVIVNLDRRIIATGYNGFPRGLPDNEEDLANQQKKRLHMIHAELNAILNATSDLKHSTLFVNRFPCHVCAGLILQAGIGNIVVPEPDLEHEHWGQGWQTALEILTTRIGIQYAEIYNSSQ